MENKAIVVHYKLCALKTLAFANEKYKGLHTNCVGKDYVATYGNYPTQES